MSTRSYKNTTTKQCFKTCDHEQQMANFTGVDSGSVGCCMKLHYETKQLKKLCHHVLVNSPKIELDLFWSSKLVKYD